jgi:hypothetical protein
MGKQGVNEAAHHGLEKPTRGEPAFHASKATACAAGK